jgi:hypothetical protein
MSYITMMLMVGIVLAAIWLLRRERRAIDHIYASEPSPA